MKKAEQQNVSKEEMPPDMKSDELHEEFLKQQNELRDRIEPIDRIEINQMKLVAGIIPRPEFMHYSHPIIEL